MEENKEHWKQMIIKKKETTKIKMMKQIKNQKNAKPENSRNNEDR